MKKIIFGMLLIVFFLMTSCSKNSGSLKGEVLFEEEWKAEPRYKDESIAYNWIIPVKVSNDTIFINYYNIQNGVRDLVETKALYDLGYSIEDRFKVVRLSQDSIPYILYIDSK